MKVKIEIAGGIGNQLFTYFAGYALASRFGADLLIEKSSIYSQRTVHSGCIDEFELEGEFTHSKYRDWTVVRFLFRIDGWCSRKWKTYKKIRVNLFRAYQSPVVGFDPNLFDLKPPIRISGYYQSYRYFSELPKEKNSKIFPKRPSAWLLENSEKFKAQGYLAIHLRLGDYNQHSDTFGILASEYYQNGLKILREHHPTNPIMVFSDDIEEAKVVLRDLKDTFEIEYLNEPLGTSPCEVLTLMSRCRGIVMANSTFSYWAALIAHKDCSIVAPSKWFKSLHDPVDMIPESWIRIESVWR